MIAQPIAPKIPNQLDPWEESGQGLLEIDRAIAKDIDMTGAAGVIIDASRIERGMLTGASVAKFEVSDTEFTRLEAAAVRIDNANVLRVAMTDCRLTGAEFAEGKFEDCTFKNVKLDETGFRFASFKRVHFENCMLRQADFSHAKFQQVTFTDCQLEDTNFSAAQCNTVDVSHQELSAAKGLLGLKGATISSEQLIQLAPLLASELGFHVKDASQEV